MQMKYHATQFEGPEEAEIMGAAVLPWIANLAANVTDPILAKHGLDANQIKADGWYNSAIMDAMFREVYKSPNGQQALVAMGKAGAESVIEQFGYTSVEDYLARCNEEFAVIRNAPDGYGYIVKKLGEGHWKFINNTNAPNDIVFGAVWEKIRLLREGNQKFSVSPMSGYYRDSKEGATFEIKVG